jgi:hypothetical protein
LARAWVCALGELRGKYPEPAARSLGGTVLFAIGVAIVIEVQGTILLQSFLLRLPDAILVDLIINIIPWKVPTNCGHSAIHIYIYYIYIYTYSYCGMSTIGRELPRE